MFLMRVCYEYFADRALKSLTLAGEPLVFIESNAVTVRSMRCSSRPAGGLKVVLACCEQSEQRYFGKQKRGDGSFRNYT